MPRFWYSVIGGAILLFGLPARYCWIRTAVRRPRHHRVPHPAQTTARPWL
jgi:hypothetical protein